MTALHKREIARGFIKPHHIQSRDELEKPKRHNKRSENRLHQNCIQFEWTCVSRDHENPWQKTDYFLLSLCYFHLYSSSFMYATRPFRFNAECQIFSIETQNQNIVYKLSNVLNKISFNQNIPFQTFNTDTMKGIFFRPLKVMPIFEDMLFSRYFKKMQNISSNYIR